MTAPSRASGRGPGDTSADVRAPARPDGRTETPTGTRTEVRPALRPMHISLRTGERLFLNGAVLRVDRKVTLELLNDATFLLENHVLQVEDTTTPLRQLYFAVQAMLMDPQNAPASRTLFEAMATDTRRILAEPRLIAGLDEAAALVAAGRPFQALKTLRSLFEEEAAILGVSPQRRGARRRPATVNAAQDKPPLAETAAQSFDRGHERPGIGAGSSSLQ